MYVKYSPIIVSLFLLLNNILAYFDIYICRFVGVVVGVSLFHIGHMYISSIAYKFCKYHRMFIHYILVTNITNIVDYYIGIPVNDLKLLLIYLVSAGIFIFLILYYYKKYGDRRK